MTATTSESPPKRVGVLGESDMRVYLGGQLVSLTGSMLQTAVLALLILDILKKLGQEDAAPYYTGLLFALNLIPGTFLAPFGGVLLDKLNKKKVLIVTGALGTLQALILVYLTYTRQTTITEINVLTFLMGIVNAIDGPGRNTIIKDAVVHEHNERQASKMFTSLYTFAQITGPGFAGFLVEHFDYPITFFLNSMSFVVLIIALLKMKMMPKEVQEASAEIKKQGVWKSLGEGIKYMLSDSVICVCILLTGVTISLGYSYYPILPVMARDMFGGQDSRIVYSHLAMASGIGSLVGIMISMKFDKTVPHKFLIIAGTILLGMSLLALSRTHDVDIAMGFLFLLGLGFMVSFSTLRSSLVHFAKKELSGVVMGFSFTFFMGGMMLGSFGAGIAAERYKCPPVLAACGIALIVVAIVTPFLPGINKLDKAK